MSKASFPFVNERLGEVITLEYGAALPDAVRSGVGNPVFGSNGIVGHHSQFLVTGPGIVVGRKGSVGAVCWTEKPFWPIDTAYYVVPKQGANLRWLFWLLSSINLKRLDAATGVPGLNRNSVYDLNILLPEPAEQSRIAAVLDTVDAAIAQTEAVITKLKQVRAGLLHDLLTRGLDEHGQLRDPIAHPEQFKDSPLGRIPREWQADYLVRAATLQRGLDLPLQERSGGTIPIYGSNGIDGWHNQAGAKGPGVITGRSGTIGFVYYCEEDFWPLNTTLYVKNFHGNEPRFIRFFLEFMKLDKFSAATGVPSLNRNFVHPTLVAIPFPAEQLKIAIRIEDCEREIAIENNYLGKLTLLKSALMSDLLTGRVRVPEGVEVQS